MDNTQIKMIQDKLLNDLNAEQRISVLYDNGPLRIIASAGSGKTKVLTRKVAYLIEAAGVDSSKILAITFTNKAASEMKSRIDTYLSEENNKVFATTFHSLCSYILRQDINKLNRSNDFYIVDKKDQKDTLKRIYSSMDINDSILSYSDIMEFIQVVKINNTDLEHHKEIYKNNDSELLKIEVFKRYERILNESNGLDFHDLLIWTDKLFNEVPYARQKWENRFDYVMVDEFQDTNAIQYDIVKVLAKKAHITIVGDPDQTIYSWRGAKVDLIINFDKDFKDTKTITLNQNYRSTKKILEKANNLIKHNKNRIAKDLITDNEEGEDVTFFHAFSMEAEATWVVKKINELKKNKNQLKQIAIFYRSNYYSRPFEEALIKENINHRIFGGERFFERKEIKDAIAFLRTIFDGNNISLLRIINTPSRKIGSVAIRNLEAFSYKKQKSIFETIFDHLKDKDFPMKTSAKHQLHRLISTILKYRKALETNSIEKVLDKFLQEIEYYESIKGDTNLRGSAIDNIKELLRSINEWEANNPDKGIKDYLDNISLISSTNDDDSITNFVSLMTIHAAKGLQFDNVFIVGLSNEIFPSMHSREGDFFSSSAEKLEEERRLAYVAITRAKKLLFISDSRGTLFNTRSVKTPSRFLKEMGINVNDFVVENISSEDDATIEMKTIEDRVIEIGDVISHSMFGEGIVIDIINDTVKIKFNNSNYGVKQIIKNHKSFTVLSSK